MKAFLIEHCKESRGKQRIGKTRGLLKKIEDTKETFHAKTGTIKDRNSKDITEVEPGRLQSMGSHRVGHD